MPLDSGFMVPKVEIYADLTCGDSQRMVRDIRDVCKDRHISSVFVTNIRTHGGNMAAISALREAGLTSQISRLPFAIILESGKCIDWIDYSYDFDEISAVLEKHFT